MGAQRIFAAAFESQKILEEERKQNIKLICKNAEAKLVKTQTCSATIRPFCWINVDD